MLACVRDAEGGIKGRKITFITYDDAYSPPKAIEQMQSMRFDGEAWRLFGDVINGEAGH